MFDPISFFIYFFVACITPGPNNIMSLSNGSKKGFAKAAPFNLGVGLGFFAVTMLCALFCDLLESFIPKIRLPMLIIGAAYMLYLAWKTSKSSGEISESDRTAGFIGGALLQFINPKVYICCTVAMESYVIPHYAGNYPMIALLVLAASVICIACTLCWTAFGSALKVIFSKHAKAVGAVMALLLVYCAVSLFI